MEQENLFEKWKTSKAGTVQIDWAKVETFLDFKLHENFKDFYSRITGGKDAGIFWQEK